MTRGSIHWARLDKRRPVVIVSPTRRNELARDVIVIVCSTALRPMPWHVLLRGGEGGLPEASMAKCEQITTLERSAIDPQPLGAPLSQERMREIERAIRLAIGVVLPPRDGPGAWSESG